MQATAWREDRDFDVLVIGDLNIDLILSGIPRLPAYGEEVLATGITRRLGGSAANFAVCCARLGMSVAFVANVGRDDFGELLISELRRWGIATDCVRIREDLATGITVSLSGAHDRAFVTYVGTIDSLRGQDVPRELLLRCRHMHIASYFLQTMLQPDCRALTRAAHAAGLSVSLDTGYDPAEQWNGDLLELISEVDLFLPNEVEAQAITGTTSAEAALAALSRLRHRHHLLRRRLQRGFHRRHARRPAPARRRGARQRVRWVDGVGDGQRRRGAQPRGGRAARGRLRRGRRAALVTADGRRPSLSPRAGTVLPVALTFAATALVLAWIAIHSLYVGRHAGSPRRTIFAALALAFACVVVAVSLAVAVRAVMRRRRLAAYLRPGELIVGVFGAELVEDARLAASARGRPVIITVTNQRLLLHTRDSGDEPWRALEHEEVLAAPEQTPVVYGALRRCLVQRLQLIDGRDLVLRMNAGAALDFAEARSQYLQRRPRDMRALVVGAEGPTPSRPSQPLSTITPNGRPAVCLLELGENYLRIIGEQSPPLADLYYYFHWEHMQASEMLPAQVPGIPESWRCLRLIFHERSSLTLCGTPAAIRRLHEHAVRQGAAPVRDS